MDLDKLMSAAEQASAGILRLTEPERQALLRWGMRMFTLGQHVVANIDQIKYDGRVVILDDGTRWEVDTIDTVTSDMWMPGDRVVVINDEMYKLDDSERVGVQQEYD